MLIQTENELLSKPVPLIAILIAQQSVMFPLYFFMPIWIAILNFAIVVIVILSETKTTFSLARWLKLAMTILATIGVLISFHKLSGRDAGSALICVMYGLKILEVKTHRDAHLLLALGFFILLAGFLFSQSPWIALYQLIGIGGILNALVVLNSISTLTEQITVPGQKLSFKEQAFSQLALNKVLKKLSKYLLLALPIMLVLFLFFPRLGGPIWRMPGTSTGATGVSDTMSPGDISSLKLSDQIAFRVKFEDIDPSTNQMYWRVLLLDQFDGFTWERSRAEVIPDPIDSLKDSAVLSNQVSYEITLEPTRQNYLVTLDKPIVTPKNASLLTDLTSYSKFRLLDRTRYQASSSFNYQLDKSLSETAKQKYTELPASGNERAKQWAINLRQQTANSVEYIQTILATINRQEYFYTLTPPIMAEDTIDSFWFDHKKGFCEHYAGALVFLARAAGIPARVVIGYQGGEKNTLSDYWIIRHANAHAWIEVWVEGEGWLRVDPTSAIAPQRVEESLLSDYRQRESLFDDFEFVELDDVGLFKQFEYWSDQFHRRWSDWVLDYNEQTQAKLFSNFGFTRIKGQQLVVAMLLITFGYLLLVSFKWFKQRRALTPIARAYLNFLARLDRLKLIKLDQSMGPQMLKNQLGKMGEAQRQAIIALLDEYIRLRYQSENTDKLKALAKKFDRIKLK